MQNMLSDRTVTLVSMFTTVNYIRNRVSKTPDGIDPKIYWTANALLELNELVNEFPVENWKPDRTINEIAIKFEIVDVIVHLISALLEDSCLSDCINDLPSDDIDTRISPIGDSRMPTLQIMERYLVLTNTISRIAFTSYTLPAVIAELCKIGNIDHATFSTAFVAKLALVAARLKDGKYRDNWNKVTIVGTTQEEELQKAIVNFGTYNGIRLSDLYDHVHTRTAKMFMY